MSVTPSLAESWISVHAAFQRSVSERKVDHWLSVMNRGEWKLTHQGIAITKEGEILDGQHRLKALVRYGKPLMMVVTFNADPSTFNVLDTGYIRSSHQIMQMSGRNLSKNQISALHTLLWKPQSVTSVMNSWNIEDLPLVADYFSGALSATYSKACGSAFRGGCIRGAGLRAIVSNPSNEKKVIRFFQVLSSGLPENASENAALQLALRLGSMTKGSGAREYRHQSYWMTCHALRLFLSGTTVKHKSNLGGKNYLVNAHLTFPTFVDGVKSFERWDNILSRSQRSLP